MPKQAFILRRTTLPDKYGRVVPVHATVHCVQRTSHFLHGTRNTRPCITVHLVSTYSVPQDVFRVLL